MKFLLLLFLPILAFGQQPYVGVKTTLRDGTVVTPDHIKDGKIKGTVIVREDPKGQPLTIGSTEVVLVIDGSLLPHIETPPETLTIPPGQSRRSLLLKTNGVPIVDDVTINIAITNSFNNSYYVIVNPVVPPPTIPPTQNKVVNIQWNPNTEPDLAGYFVHYGVVSGVYTNKLDVGIQTDWEFTDMLRGTNYYIAVSAYDTAGLEGVLSDEIISTK